MRTLKKQNKAAICGHGWLERYKKQHAYAVRSNNNQRFLVYFCPRDHSGCCGYGNRLRAVVSLFYLAILTNRTFLIDRRTPEPISNYLHPHEIQWNHTVKGLEMRGHYWGTAGAELREATGWEVRGSKKGSSFASWFAETNFLKYFDRTIEVVTTIWYFAEKGIRSNGYLMKQARALGITPLVSNIPDFALIGCAFDFLFTKSRVLESYLTRWRKLFSSKTPVIGIHIRTGDHHFDERKPINNRVLNFTELFQCAVKVEIDVFRKNDRLLNQSQWFLATDNDRVKNFAKARFPTRTIITTNFTPFHLDVRNYSLSWCNETILVGGVIKCNYTTECDTDDCISRFYVNRTLDADFNTPFNMSSRFARGILGVLVDHFLLSECDYLVLCDSSFSSTAVGLSMRTVDTYSLGDQGCVISKTGRKTKLRYFGYFKKRWNPGVKDSDRVFENCVLA